MATLNVVGSHLGTALSSILMAEDIEPGATPSYELCKQIFLTHPLGQKIAETPVRMAQALGREIIVPDGPEDDARDAFEDQWERDGATDIIANVATQTRIYGISSLAVIEEGTSPDTAVNLKKIAKASIAFNVFDPLNTAGSLVTNQNPNAIDFQKYKDISVNGTRYHRSRTVTLMNENPMYIVYQSSTFGFTGRSVYQRALFPLKSFIQTMRADDMVARKVGLIVAALKMPGSVIDAVMSMAARFKRQILKIGATDNVISIDKDETIESLDLTNLADPLTVARKDILENIATAVPMPAKLINNETFAEGFGEGTEDARHVADYIDGIRRWMTPLYQFMDPIIQRRAWNQEFFERMQSKFPEHYGSMEYEEAFYRWKNSFKATWPSLIREPESELMKSDDLKMKSVLATAQIVLPIADPDNKAMVIRFIADTVNQLKRMFPVPLELDYEALAQYTPPEQAEGGGDMKEPEPRGLINKADALDADGNDVSDRITRIETWLTRKGGRGIVRR